jgi:hypothetical protein
MLKAKIKISIGLVITVAISVWMGVKSGAIPGIAYFFLFTVLLWIFSKARHWI